MFEHIFLEFFKLNSDSPYQFLMKKENAAVAASIWVFYKDFRLCKRIWLEIIDFFRESIRKALMAPDVPYVELTHATPKSLWQVYESSLSLFTFKIVCENPAMMRSRYFKSIYFQYCSDRANLTWIDYQKTIEVNNRFGQEVTSLSCRIFLGH